MGPEKAAVKVMARVRPFNARELGSNPHEYPTSIVAMDGPKVLLLDHDGVVKDSFEFHETFWSIPESQKQYSKEPFADQVALFEKTGTVAVEAALAGYHCCIFAYGQTGSGKTYSMLGSVQDPGIAPRLVDLLFEQMSKGKGSQGFRYSVDISFMEIYNERVKDLLAEQMPLDPTGRKKSLQPKRRSSYRKLSPRGEKEESDESPRTSGAHRRPPAERRASTAKGRGSRRGTIVGEEEYKDLKVRHSPVMGVFVDGLTRLGGDQGITSADDVKDVMRFGMEHRATAETKMNATSSRSHAIFQICVRARNDVRGVQRYAHINIVDLAGSERIKMSGAEGERLVEATRINQSLSTLRRVIDILIENSSKKRGPKLVAPYRDSMLTWILSDSLGGNSKTMMLATVSPHESNREDTTNTLRYALKAKDIVNTVRINEEKSSVLVSAMQREIQELRQQLEEDDGEGGNDDLRQNLQMLEEQYHDMEVEAERAERELAEAEERLRQREEEREKKEHEVTALKSERVEEKHGAALTEFTAVEQELNMRQQTLTAAQRAAEEAHRKHEMERQEKSKLEKDKQMVHERQHRFQNEVIYVRRKQFAGAFQQAFFKNRTSVKLQELQAEVRATKDSAGRAEWELQLKAQEIRELERQNAEVEARLESLEERIKKETSERQAEERATEERIKHATEAKQKCDEINAQLQKELREIEGVYHPMLDAVTRKRKMTELNTQHLQVKVDDAKKERESKKQLVGQLKEHRVAILKEGDQLRGEMQKLRASTQEVRKRTAEGRERIEVVRAENHKQTMILADLNNDIHRQRAEVRELEDEAERLQAQVTLLRHKHKELKTIVSHRFFPTNSENPGANEDSVLALAGRSSPVYSRDRSQSPLPRSVSSTHAAPTVRPSPRFAARRNNTAGPLTANHSPPKYHAKA